MASIQHFCDLTPPFRIIRLAAEPRAYRTVAGLSSVGSSADDKRHNRRCHCPQLAMRYNSQRIVLRIAHRKNQLQR